MGVSLRGIVEGIVEDSSESDGLPPGSGADIFNNTFYCTGLNLLFSSFLNLTLSEIEMYKLQLNSLPSQHSSMATAVGVRILQLSLVRCAVRDLYSEQTKLKLLTSYFFLLWLITDWPGQCFIGSFDTESFTVTNISH